MTTDEKEIIIRETLDADREAFEFCPPKALTVYYIISEKEFALRKLNDKYLMKAYEQSLNGLSKIKAKKEER